MPDDYIECAELSGKTIQALRVHRNAGEGTGIEIELTDGTRFACSISNPTALRASLYKGGVGFPEIIREYEV